MGASGFGKAIAVDAAGNAYLTGSTVDANFPTTPGAFQTTWGGVNDAFVTKLNAAGSALIYSTFLGGGGYDDGLAVAVDTTGNAYLTGDTASANFPTTPGSFQTTFGGVDDAFATKLNANGSALVYSTYLGGSDVELGLGIAVDAAGNAYLTGQTFSNNFPTTPDAFQPTFGGGAEDAFVTELNASGSALISSSYLGGNLPDIGNGIAVDAAGNAYLAGYTQSTNFPTTPGAFQTTFGGNIANGFVTQVVARFAVFASALTPSTVSPGGSSTSTIGLSAETGFTDSVALSCSVQPSPAQGPKCSFSPSSISPGTSAQLTVSTTGPSAGVLPSRPASGPFYALWLPLMGLVVAGVGFGRKHKTMGTLSALALICVLFAGVVFQVACGSSGGGGGGSSGTPAGTYTITVSGTSSPSTGSLVRSTTTTLKVQ
jgi:hypothetical protein